MWGYFNQVTVQVAHKRSGWEAAPSDFAPAKKPSTFDPHLVCSTHTPTRWSLTWGALTCSLPHTRNHTSLAHHGAAQWEGKVGPHQPKLWTYPLGQPGPKGGRKGDCSELPHHPSLSGQVVVLPRVNVPNHIRELPAMHHPHKPGGTVWLGPLSEIPLENEHWLMLHYWLNDTLFKIELFHSIILSSRATNWKNDIYKFLQQFEWLRVNKDSNLHFKVLGVYSDVCI